MSFVIDKQTIDDLNIFGKHGKDISIYNLFNITCTRGGSLLLEEMFSLPLSDKERITERSAIIGHLMSINAEFPFRPAIFDMIEHYLGDNDKRSQIAPNDNSLQRKFRNFLGADPEYQQVYKGVTAIIELLFGVRDFVSGNNAMVGCEQYNNEFQKMAEIISNPKISGLIDGKTSIKLSYEKTAEYDLLLRFKLRDQIDKLLHHIYNLDVFTAVAKVAVRRGFVLATALDPEDNTISIKNVYHPQIPHPVANSIDINSNNNVIFLTGANMGGKSTFMKTFGVAVYLAHMGFPIPATNMVFSVRNGLFTTINLPDNLSMGYSHFYVEVLRVKKVAEAVNRFGNLIVIFDELFRGTNVKDAYDATIAITDAFAANKNCVFMISTHIIEASEELEKRCPNMNFIYLPTIMNGNVPTYTYKLTKGVTNDRHGMMIITNERVIDILKSKKD